MVCGMFVCVSLSINVCMFTVSNVLLMSNATAMVRVGGMGLLKPVATFSIASYSSSNFNIEVRRKKSVDRMYIQYISSIYSPCSKRVGLPLHNIHSSGVLMKSIGSEFLRPDALPSLNHMRGMQYQIVLNITFWSVQICVHISYTKQQHYFTL